MFDRLFLEHPRSKGETYWQHFKAAAALWVKMIGALMALVVHTFIPGFFQTTASSLIVKCHKDLAERELAEEVKSLDLHHDDDTNNDTHTSLCFETLHHDKSE